MLQGISASCARRRAAPCGGPGVQRLLLAELLVTGALVWRSDRCVPCPTCQALAGVGSLNEVSGRKQRRRWRARRDRLLHSVV